MRRWRWPGVCARHGDRSARADRRRWRAVAACARGRTAGTGHPGRTPGGDRSAPDRFQRTPRSRAGGQHPPARELGPRAGTAIPATWQRTDALRCEGSWSPATTQRALPCRTLPSGGLTRRPSTMLAPSAPRVRGKSRGKNWSICAHFRKVKIRGRTRKVHSLAPVKGDRIRVQIPPSPPLKPTQTDQSDRVEWVSFCLDRVRCDPVSPARTRWSWRLARNLRSIWSIGAATDARLRDGEAA